MRLISGAFSATLVAVGVTGGARGRWAARPQDQAGLLQLRRPAGSEHADDRGNPAALADLGLGRRRGRRASGVFGKPKPWLR